MHYIYHIPGVKIGTSQNPKKRVKQQDHSEFEILECHTDIYKASEREIELQKEYGYIVDCTPYWQTIEMQKKGRGNTFTKEQCSKGGRIGGKIAGGHNKKLTIEQAKEIRERHAKGKGKHAKNGGVTMKLLAEEYNVSKSAIQSILGNQRTYVDS